MEPVTQTEDLRDPPAPLPPSAVAQFNWTAFFWGGLYAFFYNLWSWLLILFVFGITARIGFIYLNRSPVSTFAWGILAAAFEVVRLCLFGMFGARANREAVRKGTLRTLDQLSGQRRWIVLGALLEVIGVAVGVSRFFEMMPARGSAALVAFTVRLVLVAGLWRYTVWRQQRSG